MHPSLQPKPDKNNSFKKSFRRWLPAIVFAIVINVLFISIFIMSNLENLQHQEKKSINTPNSGVLPTETSTHSNAIPTLTDTDNKKTDEQTAAQDLNKTTNKSNNISDANVEANSQTTTTDSKNLNGDNNASSSNEDNTSKSSAARPIDPIRSDSSDTAININPQNSVNVIQQQPHINPNDRLLMPRDIPEVEAKKLPQGMQLSDNDDFNSVAKETQQLNDRLSDAINAVKEQKMQQIRMDQERLKSSPSDNTNPPSQDNMPPLQDNLPPTKNNMEVPEEPTD